ncbi:MAG: CGNR zinc finger domain-containing protein [Candidatus Limnocylindrales bacterium]
MNSTPVDPHDHHLSIDDALEFLDTLKYDDGVAVDILGSAGDGIDWLRERGVVHDPCEPALEALEVPGPAADRALGHIRSVRAALRELVDATAERRPPSRKAVETVNRAMAARQRLVLTVGSPDDGRCLTLDHRHEGDPLDDALGRIAESIAREVAGGDADRIRVCANEQCRWAFYDSSRTGRRRWCDMASCGNRAKAARHRARVRASHPATAPGTATTRATATTPAPATRPAAVSG